MKNNAGKIKLSEERTKVSSLKNPSDEKMVFGICVPLACMKQVKTIHYCIVNAK